MFHPKILYTHLRNEGFGPYISIPCSILKSFINYVIDQAPDAYYPATDEGEALGIASGMRLAGKKPVVMIQNSGLGNIVDPLTSLNLIFKIPVFLIISWRGEPGKPDELQHRIMGSITTQLLQVLGISYELIESTSSIEEKLSILIRHMKHTYLPAALIIPKGTFELYETTAAHNVSPAFLSRSEAIKIIIEQLQGDEIIIASTGKISRELYFLKKNIPAPFYVLGSMGCASALGFGIAQVRPDKKVIILDGDGALLMKMGTLAMIGQHNPKNFIHVVLDNESHESTGGQPTVSAKLRFDEIAKICGYRYTALISTSDELARTAADFLKKEGPSFIQVKVQKGSDPQLGRPQETPIMLKDKFINSL